MKVYRGVIVSICSFLALFGCFLFGGEGLCGSENYGIWFDFIYSFSYHRGFERCRKADLFLIADFFNIEVSRQNTKQVIKDYLREKLVDEGILPDYSAVSAGEQPGFTAEAGAGEVLPGPATESLGESLLAVKLKELDLQIKKQECEEQKIRLRAIEAQADRDIKMRELDLRAQELNRRPVSYASF